MEKRKCLECGEKLVGRIDKKFCSDYCRNVYNNRIAGQSNNYIRKINRVLKKNRKILADNFQFSRKKLSRKDMLEQGFNFNYFTYSYITKEKKIYYYNYDYGYLILNEKYILIVEKQDYVK